MSQADYEALTALLENGFVSGVARSEILNKLFRQTSTMAAIIGALMESYSGEDVVDSGNTSALLGQLVEGLTNLAKRSSVFFLGTVTGANTKVIAFDDPYSYAAGQTVQFINTTANTGAATLNVNGLGALALQNSSGAALVAGDLPAGVLVTATIQPGTPGITAARLVGLSATQALTQTAADARYSQLSQFGSLKAASGWFSLPGSGIIVQWGIRTGVGTTETSVALPTTFPNACLWTGASGQSPDGSVVSSRPNNAANLYLRASNAGITAFYLAIGY